MKRQEKLAKTTAAPGQFDEEMRGMEQESDSDTSLESPREN
jgi:hypothetical protein